LPGHQLLLNWLRIELVLQRVEKAEINLDIRRSAANTRLKELKLLTDDTTRSTKDRISTAQEYMKIEQDLAAQEVSNQEKKVAAMLGYAEVTDDVRETIRKIGQEGVSIDQLGLSESTVEDMKAFRDEATTLYDLQSQSYERQLENQNKLNTLVDQQRKKEEAAAKAAVKAREEQIAAAKQVTDAAISESKTRLEIFIEENKGKADTLKDEVKLAEDVKDKKLAIIEEEFAAKKLTESEYELAMLQTKNEFLEDQKNLTVEYANEELEAFKSTNKSRLNEGQLLTDALVNQEENRLNEIAQKEREFQEVRLKEGEINQQEYNAAINAIDEQNRQTKEENREDLQQQQLERETQDYQNKMAAEEGNFLAQMDLEEQRMKQRHARELELAKQQGLDLKALKERQAKEEEGIEKAKQEFKVGLASQTFGNLATILGKETKLGKAAAIAQTTIDTYQSAQAAYKALAGIPVVGPALGAIAAGAAVASGLKAVQKITSTQAPQVPSGGGGGSAPRAAKGATLKGPSHAGGGMNLYDDNGRPVVNAEGDENIYVLNKRASGLINSLSYMNQATGGIPLSRTTTFAAAGGIIQSLFSPTRFFFTLFVQFLFIEFKDHLVIK